MKPYYDRFKYGRYVEVLRWMWDGKCTKQIAEEMQLSPKMVEWYRAELLKHFNADNLVTLCRRALEAGLLKLR